MRKLCPLDKWYNILFYLSLALIFGACVAPVNITEFLQDPDVINVVSSGGRPRFRIENPGNYSPILGPVGTIDNPITISISGGGTPPVQQTATITVSNALNADGKGNPYASINWSYNDGVSFTALTAADGLSSVGGAATLNQLIVNVANAPFDTRGVYQISVVGILDDISYHGDIYIMVVE